MSEQPNPTPAADVPPEATKPSFGERLLAAFLGFVRFLARLVLILLVLGLIAAAAYVAVPYAYKHYVQPLQDVQTQVNALQQETTARAEQVNQRLAALQSEIVALQSQQEALTKQLDDQQAQWEAVQQQLEALAQQNEDLTAQLEALARQTGASADQIAAIQATAEAVQAAWETWEPQLQESQQRVGVLRAMNSLLRARLLIGQTNYGLAAEELRRTQAIIGSLQEADVLAADTLAQAADQVVLAGKALPAAPNVALQNVEAAWELLNSLLPAVETTAPETTTEPAPEASPTPTPTPTPSP